MKNIICRLLCFLPAIAMAQDASYAVSAIPEALLEHANIVKRDESLRFVVESVDKAFLYHTYALTVLNEKGDDAAYFIDGYDKLQTIESISGTLYDAAGKKVKSLSKNDIKDYSGTGEAMATDNRIKEHNFYCRTYPYTVVYEVAERYKYTMFFPHWMPQSQAHMSVQHSSLSITCPADYTVRYHAVNYKKEPLQQVQGSDKTYSWEISSVPAIQQEYAAPELKEIVPSVYLAPTLFDIQDYSGDMHTWQDFGRFVYALKDGRDALPDDIKKTVHTLADKLPTIQAKVAALYKFMQDNTHYVNVSLGIGGWQPFDATYVATKRYGDCKALSNYMYSLLKEEGIPSCYTLIHAGEEDNFFLNDFPCSQFNHVILCVPLAKDTMWLECTSQTLPAGYLSGFTADRYALLITENGGTLIRTPKYGLSENQQLSSIHASLDSAGNMAINATTKYKGMQQDDLHEELARLSKEKMLDRLKEQIDLPQYDVKEYSYEEEPAVLPQITETLQLNAGNYAQATGKRLFLSPNLLNKTRRRLSADTSRQYDVVLHTAYSYADSVTIDLPAGYAPESVPAAVTLDTKFGKYSCCSKVDGSKLYYCRRLDSYSGRFPPAAYKDLVAFRDQIFKADAAKVVLVKR